ncbi:MAG: 50S ribosomal protein L29 [Minisyncoccales bacterium]
MEIEELRQKSKKELKKILNKKRKKMQEMRFNLKTGKVKEVKDIHKDKKTIARILTILNNK